MRTALVLSLLLACGTASAAPAKKPAPKPKEVVSQEQLFRQLKQAQSSEDAKPIEDKLKLMFRASGSPSVDLLMTRAQVAEGASDKKTAKKLVEATTVGENTDALRKHNAA